MDDKCFIITYQLSQDPASIIEAIKGYGTWAKVTDSTWAIVTKKSATEIRDHLASLIKADERLFVVKSGVGAAWRNVVCTNQWLKDNL